MASLSKDRGKRGVTYRVLFKRRDGERDKIHLGPVTAKQANDILGYIGKLERCLLDGSAPATRVSAWVDDLSADFRQKLAAKGLVAPKVQPVADPIKVMTLGELVAMYKARPKWLKLMPASVRNQESSLRYLVEHFGESKPLPAITEAAAEDFRDKLELPKVKGGKGLAASTANQAATMAWSLWRFACKSRIVSVNVFDDVERGRTRRGDNVFVATADCLKVLDELPDSEWRLLFALSRWAGLRIPSEPRLLKWGHIDRANNRITIPSPKTARYEGRDKRVIPIFGELVKYIDERWAEAEDGEEYVLPMMRRLADSSFANKVCGAIERAGVEKWPRLFHSMRSTRQTELQQHYPAYVVCRWLGNTERIAGDHYLMVTADHFISAAARNTAQTASGSASQDATAVTVG